MGCIGSKTVKKWIQPIHVYSKDGVDLLHTQVVDRLQMDEVPFGKPL